MLTNHPEENAVRFVVRASLDNGVSVESDLIAIAL